jgi:hypothetical protein
VPLDAELTNLVVGVTKKWAKQRKAEERSRNAAGRRAYMWVRRDTIKDAAWQCMGDAYNKASNNGQLPANARQVMYAARGPIQEMTGLPLDANYFIQTLLKEYLEQVRPGWRIAYDARGHFTEPHTRHTIGLGTLGVMGYRHDIDEGSEDDPLPALQTRYPTVGPANRYGAALFIEKEGFDELFREAKLAQRFDIAIMSTKGMSNVASRDLIRSLGVPTYVLHDFDQAGFSILGTLPRGVINLGLTLADIEHYGLAAEDQALTQNEWTLRGNGATSAEIAFLKSGKRVELNMLASDELIELIETRLTEHGVKKVIPSPDVLTAAYRRAVRLESLNTAIEAGMETADAKAEAASVPADLEAQIQAHVKLNPAEPWDTAIAGLVGLRPNDDDETDDD